MSFLFAPGLRLSARERNLIDMKQNQLRSLARAAVIAALYTALTLLLQPISFGAIQFRVAEALTLLPILCAEAVPGLFVGCLLANLLGGGVWFDVVFGSLATLLAAVLTRSLRKQPFLAALMPVLANGLIVGAVVYLGYVRAPGDPVNTVTLLSTMGTVALGEAVVCYVLGLPMLAGLRRIPGSVFGDN